MKSVKCTGTCIYHESSYSQDGHRLLGYKILCGHVWAWEHCPHVRHVAKSDDNVVVDMDTLVTRYNAGLFLVNTVTTHL